MKTTILVFVFSIFAFSQKSIAVQNAQNTDSIILTSYYAIKDALVKSNSTDAAANAKKFIEAVNGATTKTISDERRKLLLSDAEAIAKTKNIKVQRDKFVNLSDNMFTLAKAVKLSSQLVYQQYCPMKKATWFSSTRSIKNPYYGNAMLTCGSIKQTL